MSQGPEILKNYLPHSICHRSHVTCHVARVTCCMYKYIYIYVLSQPLECLISTGPTPFSFYISAFFYFCIVYLFYFRLLVFLQLEFLQFCNLFVCLSVIFISVICISVVVVPKQIFQYICILYFYFFCNFISVIYISLGSLSVFQ